MYEARQNKEKVSRRIDNAGGGMTRQRIKRTHKKANDNFFHTQEGDKTQFKKPNDIKLIYKNVVQNKINVDEILKTVNDEYIVPKEWTDKNSKQTNGVNKSIIIGEKYVILYSTSEDKLKKEIDMLTILQNLSILVPEFSDIFKFNHNGKKGTGFLETKLSSNGDGTIIESKYDKSVMPSKDTGKIFAEKILKELDCTEEYMPKYVTALTDAKKLLERFENQEKNSENEIFFWEDNFYIPDIQLAFDYNTGHIFVIDPGDIESSERRPNVQQDMIKEVVRILESKKYYDGQKFKKLP